MMESMRNAAKGWVAKVLIGLLAVSFGVWGIADVFRGSSTGALATVGKQEVTPQQFERAFQDYLRNMSQQTGRGLTPEEARTLGIDKAILENLLQTAALDNEAEHLGLGVSDQFMAGQLVKNPNLLDASGKFDADRFRSLLAQNGLSESMFFESERQRLLRTALTVTAGGDIAAPRGMLEAQYRYASEQRDARYFIVTAAESEVTPPTEDEIRKEYEANPAAYTAPEYRSAAIMKVEPQDIAARVNLTDQDIADGFEKYKGDYFTPETRTILQITFPTLEEAEAAKAKIAAGTDFMTLAKERGFAEADVTFANRTRAEFVDPAIAEAAFALAQGEVSAPVKGALATALLKAETITPERQSTLDEVKEQLSERLKLERANEEIQSIYDAVEDARAAQTSFEDIAAKAGIPFQLIAATDAQGRDKDGKDVAMPQKAELVKAVFTSDAGIENDALSLDNGYIWYEVREVVPSALRPLDQVREQAKAAVTAQKLRALAEEKAKKLVDRAKAGATLDDLARESGATVQTVQGLRRAESSAGFGPAAVAAIFAAPENGFAHAVEPDGKGARVMQAQPVMLPAFDPASAEAKAIAEQMKAQLGDDMVTAYLAALENEAGVSLNETLWRNLSGQQTN
jgi:peptidyl-prolyl cis-trans isomerase D